MNLPSIPLLRRCLLTGFILAATFSAIAPIAARATTVPALLDDYSDAHRNAAGVERLIITDKDAGGQSQATQSCENGVLTVQGKLVPGRGMPAFISLVSLLSPEGQPQDVSRYTGVRLRVKVKQGMLSVQVASSEIQNFDYHTSAPIARTDALQEVRIPFKDLRRGWSEQVPLNVQTVTSVVLVAAGMAPGAFAYEVDEVGFY